MKRNIQIALGVLSLVGILAYTFVHTGNLLATYVNPAFIGFVAALGIELSIVGLSMRIGELRRSGLSTRFFVVTLVSVVVVSAVANIAEGFGVRYGEPITIANVQKLDFMEAFIAIAATGLISLVTLALSEIVGQDVIAAQKAQQRKSSASSGGYEIVPNVSGKLSNPVEVPQLTAPQEPEDKPDANVISDEEFSQKMDELGASAPQSIGAVELMFSLSHATAQRRLSNYRKAKK